MITTEGKARKNGETGTALVITLMVMVIMCLIGAAALMTSSVDLRISGNYRVAKQAFYLADAGLSYVRINPPRPWFLINGTEPERLTNLTVGEQKQTGIGNFQADITYGVTSGTIPPVTKKVTNPPEGSGTGIRTGKAYHYTISSTGYGENQAQAQVEMLGYVIGK